MNLPQSNSDDNTVVKQWGINVPSRWIQILMIMRPRWLWLN